MDGLYTIYDRVAEEGSPPFVARTDGVAVRQFQAAILGGKVLNPDDYVLYRVGGWDSTALSVSSETLTEIIISVPGRDMEVESDVRKAV